MPCRPWEKPKQVPEPEHPVTPAKPACDDGVSHAYHDPDAEDPANQSEEEEELAPKKQSPPRHVLTYVVVKRCAR